MPSRAYRDFLQRDRDVDQLLRAHESVVRSSHVNAAAAGGTGLAQLAQVALALVRPAGPGRPAEVDAINRAAIVLLTAHLEGFLEDLHGEAASILLMNRVRNLDTLIDEAHDRFRNPTIDAITKLFNTLGMPDFLDGMSWQRSKNEAVKRRLTELVKLRNDIAHGEEARVTKRRVVAARRFVGILAQKLDEKVGTEIRQVTQVAPW
ncbi:MAG TPA: HEPN domain-containing protein [Candidatus Bathyarchaeia archaeon]|nr:HEPN domain-containing protein [Candidatus Bathyarchaeia archaeon]